MRREDGMSGSCAGDLALNAAIYQREVCEVCLNCEKPKCTHTTYGCEAFRAAVQANVQDYRRRGSGRRADGCGGQDAAGVGRRH